MLFHRLLVETHAVEHHVLDLMGFNASCEPRALIRCACKPSEGFARVEKFWKVSYVVRTAWRPGRNFFRMCACVYKLLQTSRELLSEDRTCPNGEGSRFSVSRFCLDPMLTFAAKNRG